MEIGPLGEKATPYRLEMERTTVGAALIRRVGIRQARRIKNNGSKNGKTRKETIGQQVGKMELEQ